MFRTFSITKFDIESRIDKISVAEIAKVFGCTDKTIYNRMKMYGIPAPLPLRSSEDDVVTAAIIKLAAEGETPYRIALTLKRNLPFVLRRYPEKYRRPKPPPGPKKRRVWIPRSEQINRIDPLAPTTTPKIAMQGVIFDDIDVRTRKLYGDGRRVWITRGSMVGFMSLNGCAAAMCVGD